MSRRTQRTAFTLIELLTVMAIIVVLIGILTPALSAARDRAKKTAVAAQINAMKVGLEAFRNDQDEYPASNAALYATDPNGAGLVTEMMGWEVGTMAAPLQGAHLLVDALIGRDALGYDPRAPTFPAGSGTPYDRWNPQNDRRQPYIPVDGVSLTNSQSGDLAEDSSGDIPNAHPTGAGTGPGAQDPAEVFKDEFGWPILYYRASPTTNQNTPIITTPTSPFAAYGNGVYDGFDNTIFTSYGGANPHKILDANMTMASAPPGSDTLPNAFAEFIRSFRATTYEPNGVDINFARPVNADSFIILSAGKDGIYGNLDDVANYEVLSKDR